MRPLLILLSAFQLFSLSAFHARAAVTTAPGGGSGIASSGGSGTGNTLSMPTLRRATFYTTNAGTGPGTITAPINVKFLTNNSGSFTNIHPGDEIVVGGGTDQYTVAKVFSSNYLSIIEFTLNSYAAVTWVLYPASAYVRDINGTYVGFTGGGGGPGILAKSNTDKFWIVDDVLGINHWSMSYESSSYDFGIYNYSGCCGNGGTVLRLSSSAKYDSIWVKPDSIVAFSWGTTNLGNSYANHYAGRTNTPPTIAAGAGAGTGPTLTLSTNSSDVVQTISLTTGTLPTGSAVVFTVTFGTAYLSPPHVVFSAGNNNAAALAGLTMVYEDQTATTKSAYTFKVGGTGLAASTAYIWEVMVIQ